MTSTNPVIRKKKRGPAPTGKTPLVALRVPAALTADLDSWIARQPDPQPSRSDAIRRLLTEALAKPNVAGAPQSDAALDQQIVEQKKAIAEMPEPSAPSPEAAMATMDKAMAQNELVDMKNKRTRRKLRTKALDRTADK